jgi:hypothetical protein
MCVAQLLGCALQPFIFKKLAFGDGPRPHLCWDSFVRFIILTRNNENRATLELRVGRHTLSDRLPARDVKMCYF